MASMPSSPQRTPPPDPNPDNSGGANQVEGDTNNGVFHGDEKKPQSANGLDYLDSRECIERFKKHDADYTRRLLAKYFSGKTIYGGNLFDENITIDDEIIKSSRWPCFRSYADPVVGFEDQCSNGSTPTAETTPNSTNVEHIVKDS
ncbi:hypothetical protein L6164_014462 [Bauhinia variegata]|uniref:Uncharacterized protein n=1 Tax=Bauhinia variegata TaxID=167791 RepID=A0ACB9NI47_BAUVA|nr:hypothetical protein L6164_014462 [Bauhinia variegata]